MKKLTIILLIVAVLCCSIAVVGCNKLKYSETFEGAISTTTYESKEDAAKGFLDEEISGAAFIAEYVEYKKSFDLSQKEIDALAIDKEFKDGISSVEKGEIEYRELVISENDKTDLLTKVASDTKKRIVYIVSYTSMFRFFVPANSNGESLSSSYFGSTFDATKYLNCSMDAEMTVKTSESGHNSTVKTKAICKITEEGIYEYDETRNFDDVGEILIPNTETYGLTMDGQLYLVSRTIVDLGTSQNAMGWHAERSYKQTVSEYFVDWFRQRFNSLDHSYFEKTDTGYKLREDLYAEYLKEATAEELEDFALEYTINIKDGRMADVKIRIAYDGFDSTMTLKFSKFGKTTLDAPIEVKNFVEENKDRYQHISGDFSDYWDIIVGEN